ncbi:Protein translocase subunit SecE [Buchnera aphidicola (Tetraneura ulmi)]|uniref:preprotein translocase subunit SecE n=1 Tax=Buchnera aphidicola TaxID=9 RepID=UPI003463ECF9
MYKKNQKNLNKIEKKKWIIIIITTFLLVLEKIYFLKTNTLKQTLLTFLLTSIILFYYSKTKNGKKIITIIKESKIEIKKIIWPTTKETLYITLTISIVTTLISLILWTIDKFFFHMISFITNSGL